MEEQIPEDVLECWEHPHFKQAQDRLLMRMREIPRKKMPYLTSRQRILWNNAQQNNVNPQLLDTPRNEKDMAFTVNLQMYMRAGKPQEGDMERIMEFKADIVVFKLRDMFSKQVFSTLPDPEKIAVVRYMFADRSTELAHQYKLALKKAGKLSKLEERQDNLQDYYRQAIKNIVGW